MTTLGGARREVAISAADANRHFSKLLRAARAGRTHVITSHGRPIARLVPIDEPSTFAAAARRALFARLTSQPVVNAGRWTRDELYER